METPTVDGGEQVHESAAGVYFGQWVFWNDGSDKGGDLPAGQGLHGSLVHDICGHHDGVCFGQLREGCFALLAVAV